MHNDKENTDNKTEVILLADALLDNNSWIFYPLDTSTNQTLYKHLFDEFSIHPEKQLHDEELEKKNRAKRYLSRNIKRNRLRMKMHQEFVASRKRQAYQGNRLRKQRQSAYRNIKAIMKNKRPQKVVKNPIRKQINKNSNNSTLRTTSIPSVSTVFYQSVTQNKTLTSQKYITPANKPKRSIWNGKPNITYKVTNDSELIAIFNVKEMVYHLKSNESILNIHDFDDFTSTTISTSSNAPKFIINNASLADLTIASKLFCPNLFKDDTKYVATPVPSKYIEGIKVDTQTENAERLKVVLNIGKVHFTMKFRIPPSTTAKNDQIIESSTSAGFKVVTNKGFKIDFTPTYSETSRQIFAFSKVPRKVLRKNSELNILASTTSPTSTKYMEEEINKTLHINTTLVKELHDYFHPVLVPVPEIAKQMLAPELETLPTIVTTILIPSRSPSAYLPVKPIIKVNTSVLDNLFDYFLPLLVTPLPLLQTSIFTEPDHITPSFIMKNNINLVQELCNYFHPKIIVPNSIDKLETTTSQMTSKIDQHQLKLTTARNLADTSIYFDSSIPTIATNVTSIDGFSPGKNLTSITGFSRSNKIGVTITTIDPLINLKILQTKILEGSSTHESATPMHDNNTFSSKSMDLYVPSTASTLFSYSSFPVSLTVEASNITPNETDIGSAPVDGIQIASLTNYSELSTSNKISPTGKFLFVSDRSTTIDPLISSPLSSTTYVVVGSMYRNTTCSDIQLFEFTSRPFMHMSILENTTTNFTSFGSPAESENLSDFNGAFVDDNQITFPQIFGKSRIISDDDFWKIASTTFDSSSEEQFWPSTNPSISSLASILIGISEMSVISEMPIKVEDKNYVNPDINSKSTTDGEQTYFLPTSPNIWSNMVELQNSTTILTSASTPFIVKNFEPKSITSGVLLPMSTNILSSTIPASLSQSSILFDDSIREMGNRKRKLKNKNKIDDLETTSTTTPIYTLSRFADFSLSPFKASSSDVQSTTKELFKDIINTYHENNLRKMLDMMHPYTLTESTLLTEEYTSSTSIFPTTKQVAEPIKVPINSYANTKDIYVISSTKSWTDKPMANLLNMQLLKLFQKLRPKIMNFMAKASEESYTTTTIPVLSVSTVGLTSQSTINDISFAKPTKLLDFDSFWQNTLYDDLKKMFHKLEDKIAKELLYNTGRPDTCRVPLSYPQIEHHSTYNNILPADTDNINNKENLEVKLKEMSKYYSFWEILLNDDLKRLFHKLEDKMVNELLHIAGRPKMVTCRSPKHYIKTSTSTSSTDWTDAFNSRNRGRMARKFRGNKNDDDYTTTTLLYDYDIYDSYEIDEDSTKFGKRKGSKRKLKVNNNFNNDSYYYTEETLMNTNFILNSDSAATTIDALQYTTPNFNVSTYKFLDCVNCFN